MVFSGDTVIDRVTPHWAIGPMLNRPRIDDGMSLEFLTPDHAGYPLFAERSRMSDGLRFFPDPEACERIAANPTATPTSPVQGYWETPDQQLRAIEHELVAGRDLLEQKLRTHVRHICLPWGVSGTLTRQALARTGYATAFANRMAGRFVVAAQDDPFYLKRLHERYVFALPGRGRRTLLRA
jgi:hypothetical protein